MPLSALMPSQARENELCEISRFRVHFGATSNALYVRDHELGDKICERVSWKRRKGRYGWFTARKTLRGTDSRKSFVSEIDALAKLGYMSYSQACKAHGEAVRDLDRAGGKCMDDEAIAPPSPLTPNDYALDESGRLLMTLPFSRRV